jgi:hypothetical protein
MAYTFNNYEVTSTNFSHPDVTEGQHTNGPATVWVRHRGEKWLCTHFTQAHVVQRMLDAYGDLYLEMLVKVESNKKWTE